MIINPINDTSDPSFLADEQAAINILDAAFTANITINIRIGFGDYNGTPLPNQSISGGNVNFAYAATYSQLRGWLTNAADPGFFNNTNLPNAASINGISNFWISSSQARAFGVLPASHVNDIDGIVGIGTNFTPGTVRIAALLHEIGHAMARVPENFFDAQNNTYYSSLDLWRFTSAGNRLFDGTINPPSQGIAHAYFSLDGGATHVADWGIYSDPSDFLNPPNGLLPGPYSNLTPNDPFNEIVGNLGNLTNTDLLIMDALGFRHGHIGPALVVGSGDFNNNGNPDFVWNSNNFISMWEYNPTAQTVSNTGLQSVPGWGALASAHFSNTNGSSTSSSQMLMDYVPNGTMTLWWVSNGALTGINLGQNWPNISFLSAGQFSNLGGANITNFVVTNVTDHHLYDWWISSSNTLSGIDLGPYWANVSLVTVGQFTNNGGTNLLVSNNIDHHLYDWWIGSNNQLQGIDLGPYWSNVAIVANGQFTTNGGTNFLVTNTIDHHLYDWWINGSTLQGFDLGAYWSGVQLVTVGRFDNHTTNTEILVQNPADHHLYEWWISGTGQLTGIDLGAYWANVQLIGNSHYNNNSTFNELLVRNTVDGHFYEWWISGNQLTGVDLGAVPGGAAGAAAGDIAAANLIPLVAGAAPINAGASPSPGSSPAPSPMQASLSPVSSDSTSLLVQSMASFGASDTAVSPTGAILPDGVGQLSEIVTPNDQHLAHG
jgi:hypothetical protein